MRIFGNAQVLLAGLSLGFQGAHALVFRGVNLGSWLVSEPWMVPTLYNSTGAVDEWHLCAALGKTQCFNTLSDHWSNFITRDDFVQIKNADAVRIPFGYWAVDLHDSEPYVAGSYIYLIRAVQWAKDIGLNVFIDMHGAPGSQNGWEESGLEGSIGFFSNTSNGDRLLNVLKNLTTEFSKSEYGGVVTNIEIMNEPLLDYSPLRIFYSSAANVVGAGNSSGINTTISDGFYNPLSWQNYNPWDGSATTPAPHLTVDTHQFWAFPPLDKLSEPELLTAICSFAKSQLRLPAQSGVPPTIVGEWSLSTGITANSTTDAYGDVAKRTWFRTLFEAQNAAFTPSAAGQASIGWFFWSWKTDYNIDAWSYQKGLQQQYIPSNISDPSTYIFPIGSDGCIDASYNYTAPVLASSGTSSSSSSTTSTTSPTSTTGTGSGSQSASTPATTTKASAASRHALQGWAAFAFVALVSMTLV